MADFAVSTIFSSKDRVTKTLKAMGIGADKFGRKSSIAFDKANRKGLTFKNTLGAILSAQVITRGVGLLTRGIRSVGEEFVTFDDAITKAGAKFPIVAKRGSESFLKLETTARKVGATTKFSATEAAEGLDFLAMAGFNAEQAMAALPQVTNLAVVADTDLARATDIASDALGSFNLMTKDSVKLTENLTRINDVFAKTVTSANTDMEMLFETMKDAGPVMTAAGAGVETFAALTGKMADAGIKGSKAGTTLKNIFLRLQAPERQAAVLMKKLRLELIDSDGKLRDITEILGDFNKATSKMGKAQKAAAVNTIFGKRAIAGVSVLLAQGKDELQAYRKTLIESGGAAQDMADIIDKSLGNRLKALRSAAIEMGFKFIDAFKEKIPGAIDSAVEAVRKFDVKAAIEGIKNFASNVSKVIKLLKDLRPLIEIAAILWISYKVAVQAVIAVKAITFFWGMAAALKAAGTAQGFLNVAMLANPIGVVALAVAGLVTAGVMLYRQWDNIKVLWNLMVSDIGDGIRKIKEWFRTTDFGKNIIAGIKIITEKWLAFKKLFVKEKVEGVPKVETAAGARQAKVIAGLEAIRTKQEARLAALPKLPGRGAERGIAPPPRVPPNKEEVAMQTQTIAFRGGIDIRGAPPGTTVEAETTGAPPIDMNLIGFNI